MLYALLVAALVALDQLVKHLVVQNIPLGHHVPFLPHIMDLTYVQNTGAAFSLFNEHTWILTLISLAGDSGGGSGEKILAADCGGRGAHEAQDPHRRTPAGSDGGGGGPGGGGHGVRRSKRIPRYDLASDRAKFQCAATVYPYKGGLSGAAPHRCAVCAAHPEHRNGAAHGDTTDGAVFAPVRRI